MCFCVYTCPGGYNPSSQETSPPPPRFPQGGLTLATVLTLLKQAIGGLLHLHGLGILHRNLRAANLLIDSLDPLRVMVADFGLPHHPSAGTAGRAPDAGAAQGPSTQVLCGCCSPVGCS